MERREYLLIGTVFILALVLGFVFSLGIKRMKGAWMETRVEEPMDADPPPSRPKESRQPVDFNEMLNYYQERLNNNPKDLQAMAGVADSYFGLQRYREAAEYYKKAIELDPKDVDSYNDLGLAYHYIGMSDEGLKFVEQGILANPLYQRIWLTKGYILATTGRVEDAIKAWEKAYALGPETDVGKAAKGFMENAGF